MTWPLAAVITPHKPPRVNLAFSLGDVNRLVQGLDRPVDVFFIPFLALSFLTRHPEPFKMNGPLFSIRHLVLVVLVLITLPTISDARKTKPKMCRVKKSVVAAAQQPFATTTSTCAATSCPTATTATATKTRTTTTASSSSTSASITAGAGALVKRSRFPYGSEKIRGVNLGGWFVLEPWINPGIFEDTNNADIVDEYTFGQYQDTAVAQSILEKHWDTWITEDDFAAISKAGLNHVRIPMPFWSIPTANTSTAPYISGSWPRLLKAVSWASKYDISVIIDIHGAPGSQNGYDNSGQLMGTPQWHTSDANVDHTLQAFETLVKEFSQDDKWGGTVGAIEALNEPAGFIDDVRQTADAYWKGAYEILKNVRVSKGTETGDGTVDSTEIRMAIMDGFIGVANYQNFLTPPSAEGVLMDTHSYQIFNPSQRVLDDAGHVSLACEAGAKIANDANGAPPTYIGEWTTSATDCTPWLNGRFRGSNWVTAVSGRSCDGMTGNWQDFSDDFKTFLARYFEAQVAGYEKALGWIYWTWKTETTDEWSYSKGIEGGWIPADITDPTLRRYPDVCS